MADELEEIRSGLSAARKNIERVIFGMSDVIDCAITALLSGGHALLVGAPGLAKTKLVQTMGVVFGLETKRVQFTPDLMPADILGSEILDETEGGLRAFRFVKGPVFCQLLMADEINRAGPKTQSALLQAMQEGRISVAGDYRELPKPFFVLATQNPLEQEGTYPLPEAQLDRFLMRIDIGYPSLQAEREMLLATTGPSEIQPERVFDAGTLIEAQRLVRRLPVGETVLSAILTLVRQGRPESSTLDLVRNHVSWGPGPRAAQALTLAVRARALLDGRTIPDLGDVQALAHPVLKHRMALGFSARAEGISLDEVIKACIGAASA
ncbi:ATPase [Alphaproteobacteria bacterium]|nr:ATPase [Alphaproteobacteria bacterium]